MPDTKSTYGWLWHAMPVLVLAAVLRFYGFGEVQLTNDELSALTRLSFTNLSDLLKYGVEVDNHPALTHLFMWGWTAILGTAAWLVKLPFVIMSLGAILILYHMAYAAFGRNTADLMGVILAAGQMFPVFALQARPYAMGMLICSALAWTWFRIAVEGSDNRRLYTLLGILLALSVYTHYFSGLLGVVIWTSGWVYHQNLNKKRYMGSALLGVLLFAPHLPITITQLGHKGIGGWLRAPDAAYFTEWVQGLLNYHTTTIAVATILLAVGLVIHVRNSEKSFWTLPIILILWFCAVFAVGYAYSILIDPLLHHGALLFSAPFFVMGLAAVAVSPGIAGRFSALILAIPLVYSLVATRQHFTILKTQPYATVFATLDELNKKGQSALGIIHQKPDYLAYYGNASDFDFSVVNQIEQEATAGELISQLVKMQPEVFFTDGRIPSLSLAAKEMFNHVEMIEGFTFTGLTFSNQPEPKSPFETLALLETALETSDEFVPMYKTEPGMAGLRFGDEVGGLVRFSEKPATEVFLTLVFSKGEETVHWSAGNLAENSFAMHGKSILPHQVLLWDIFIAKAEMKDVVMNMYIWNPEQTPLKISSWEANLMHGNPNRYSQLIRRP